MQIQILWIWATGQDQGFCACNKLTGFGFASSEKPGTRTGLLGILFLAKCFCWLVCFGWFFFFAFQGYIPGMWRFPG